MERRALLATLGAAGAAALAGCSVFGNDDAPAGSLRFVNDDDLPHVVGVTVTGVGAEPGGADGGPGAVAGDVTVPERQRDLSATAALDAGERRTYEGVFTEAVWYGVAFTLDGREPEDDTGRTTYNPAPPDAGAGRVLRGEVGTDGGFTWGVSSTSNAGRFTVDG